jgi:DNA invertase Pin-like site-specific DNA recombinase
MALLDLIGELPSSILACALLWDRFGGRRLTSNISTASMLDMRLAVYCRTSTANGAGSDSLAAQEDVCRAWAAEHGHEVAVVFRDDAISGSVGIEGRPGLAAALLSLEDKQADGIVVHRIDRLARELHVQEVALARAWSVGDHVAVFEAAEGGEIKRDDPDDPHRRFLRQVMGAAAELERGLIRARLQGGRRRKAERGGYIGGSRLHARYGYRLVDGAYEPVEAEQAVIRQMIELRKDGATWAAVADALNAAAITPPSGAAWYPMTCRRIVQAPSARMLD